MPEMTHPDLPGVVIDVDVHKARNRRKSGWVDVEPDPDDVDEPGPDDTVEDDD